MKSQVKTLTKLEISNIPSKELKVMIIKMLTDLRRRMDEHSENYNKELENIRKNPSELKNTINEMKNILEEINSRLDDTEEQISNLKDRVVEITQAEQKREKNCFDKNGLRDFWDNIKHINIHIIGSQKKKR